MTKNSRNLFFQSLVIATAITLSYFTLFSIFDLYYKGTLDWYWIKANFDIIQEGLNSPLNFISGKLIYSGNSNVFNNFFGLYFYSFPYAIKPPWFLFLLIVPIKYFLAIHFFIFIFLGCLGFLKLCSYFQINLKIAQLFCINYFFIGFFTGRFAAGHFQLLSFYCFPLVLYLVLRIAREKIFFSKHTCSLILLYEFILFSGGAISLWQISIFIGLYLASNKKFLYLLKFYTYVFLVNFWIIYPALKFSNYSKQGNSRTVFQGYGWKYGLDSTQVASLEKLNYKLTYFVKIAYGQIESSIHQISDSLIKPIQTIQGGSWEWDIYFGFLMITLTILSFILFFDAWKYIFKRIIQVYSQLFVSVFLISMLSLSIFSRLIFSVFQNFLQVPAIDRLPSRFALIPLTFLFIILAKMTTLIFYKFNSFTKFLISCLLLINVYFLMIHARKWADYAISQAPSTTPLSTQNNWSFLNVNLNLLFIIIFGMLLSFLGNTILIKRSFIKNH